MPPKTDSEHGEDLVKLRDSNDPDVAHTGSFSASQLKEKEKSASTLQTYSPTTSSNVSQAPRTATLLIPPVSIEGVAPPSAGQKAIYRLSGSGSKASLQAQRLALQIRELQIQHEDLLRASASANANGNGNGSTIPASPISSRAPSIAGPPPQSPLPAIPSSSPHPHPQSHSQEVRAKPSSSTMSESGGSAGIAERERERDSPRPIPDANSDASDSGMNGNRKSSLDFARQQNARQPIAEHQDELLSLVPARDYAASGRRRYANGANGAQDSKASSLRTVPSIPEVNDGPGARPPRSNAPQQSYQQANLRRDTSTGTGRSRSSIPSAAALAAVVADHDDSASSDDELTPYGASPRSTDAYAVQSRTIIPEPRNRPDFGRPNLSSSSMGHTTSSSRTVIPTAPDVVMRASNGPGHGSGNSAMTREPSNRHEGPWAPDPSNWASEVPYTDEDQQQQYDRVLAGVPLSHLPDWAEIESGSGPTSHPIVQIQRDLDFSLRRLINMHVFEDLLDDKLGRYRFRDFLVSAGATAAIAELDLWLDLQTHASMCDKLQANAEAIQDLFLANGSPHRVTLPGNIHREVDVVLRSKTSSPVKPEVAFNSAAQYLLDRLYNSEFQSFVKHKVIEQADVKLGKANLTNADGLGDCFCLTNPRLRDHPIVLVSDGFNAVTGYSRSQIIGRNCRFLQGPGTAPESVQRIRDGLNSGEGCNELLLNYRRDGSPFFCLLCIIPLRDASGQLIYFIGGQTNVTGVFAESKNLSFLISGDASSERVQFNNDDDPKVSPAMLEYKQGAASIRGRPDTDGSSLRPPNGRGAAGSFIDGLGQNAAGGFSDAYLASPEFGGPSAPSGNGFAGTIGKLFKRPNQDVGPVPSFGMTAAAQRLVGTGAEAALGSSPAAPLQNQIASFKNVYSKLIVLKKAKREVIFVTKDLLLYLGLPASSIKELYASSLIHADLLDCIGAGDKNNTKIIRTKLKRAIKADESISAIVSLRLAASWSGIFQGRGEQTLRTGALHLTPLRERDGSCVAYVGVFG